MRSGAGKTNDAPDAPRPSGARPAVSPFLELRPQEDASGAKQPAKSGPHESSSSLDLSSELRKLREASPLIDGMQDSALKSAARLVFRSFGAQLAIFSFLSVLTVVVPMAASKLAGVRLEPGAFGYFMYFVLGTLFFTRHRYKESFTALFVILGLAIGFHLLHLYPGFKPTTYFWFTILVIGTVNAFFYNDYTVTIGEQNLELRALRREVMQSDRLVGRVAQKGGGDEIAFVKRAQDEVAQTRAHYSSLIANLMQFGGAGAETGRGGGASAPNYAVITRAIWQLLKRGVGATRMEVLFHDANKNLLYTVKAFVTAEKAGDGAFGFAQAPSEEIAADKAKMSIPLDRDSLFKTCVGSKRLLLRNDIDREGHLKELEAKTTCPVHSLIPLLDGETVLGVINISECSKRELSDEDKTILRTTARLAAMALAHAQTFLQTKEELEAAKVLTGEEKKKRAEVMKVFKTLVSANIVEEILNDPTVMNPKRQRITIIFVDLRGFTTLSERLDAANVVELLDDFFETLTPLIFKYGGTLDKYIGDEIMALWGAPFAKPGDTKNAILCAVEMMQAMESVKVRWKQRQNLDVAMGIAINTGEAIVGSIGSTANKNFTAIGDAVNTCARLEGLSEANQILITRATYDDVRDIVKVKQLPSQHVKGKAIQLEIYEVLGLQLDGLPEPARAVGSGAESPSFKTGLGSGSVPILERSGISRAADQPELSLPRAAEVIAESTPTDRLTRPGAGFEVKESTAPVTPSRPGASRTTPLSSRPGKVREPEPLVAAAPPPVPAPATSAIGSSRELASRVSDARSSNPLGSGKLPIAKDDSASRGSARVPGLAAQGEGVACSRCRHLNRQPGLKRCDKCGEPLLRP